MVDIEKLAKLGPQARELRNAIGNCEMRLQSLRSKSAKPFNSNTLEVKNLELMLKGLRRDLKHYTADFRSVLSVIAPENSRSPFKRVEAHKGNPNRINEETFDEIRAELIDMYNSVVTSQRVKDEIINPYLDGLIEGVIEAQPSSIIPEQVEATRMKVLDGKIAVDRQSGQGDLDRIREQQPSLLGQLDSAFKALTDGGPQSNAFGFLGDIVTAYHSEISKEAADIDFNIVFARGCRLRRTLDRADKLSGKDDYADLDPNAAAAIETVLDLHNNFMMATDLGESLVAENALFRESPKQQRDAVKTVTELRDHVESDLELIAMEDRDIILDSLNIDFETSTVKETLFSRRTAFNLSVIVGSVMAVGGAAAFLAPTLGAATPAAAFATGLIVGPTAVKNSKELGTNTKASSMRGVENIVVFGRRCGLLLIRSVELIGNADWIRDILNSEGAEIRGKQEDEITTSSPAVTFEFIGPDSSVSSPMGLFIRPIIGDVVQAFGGLMKVSISLIGRDFDPSKMEHNVTYVFLNESGELESILAESRYREFTKVLDSKDLKSPHFLVSKHIDGKLTFRSHNQSLIMTDTSDQMKSLKREIAKLFNQYPNWKKKFDQL